MTDGPAQQLWRQQYTGLCAELGDKTTQRRALDKRIAELEAAIDALNASTPLAQEMDKRLEVAAEKPPEAP